MTILIHGFGSSGQNGKAKLFREYYRTVERPFIAPSLSNIPKLAMTTLEELIESYDEVNLIGSSLGGYYAIYLAEKYGLKAVLINPSIYPAETLQRAIGMAVNYYDNSPVAWSDSYLEMLKSYEVSSVESDYLLLLQKGDDLLDYRDAVAKIPDAEMMIEDGGSHPFDGVERYFDRIDKFLVV